MQCRVFQGRPSWSKVLPIITWQVCMTSFVWSEPLQLVVPNAYESAEADGAGGWPVCLRYQNIYRSDLFAALPGGGGYLTSVRYRPDGATDYPADWLVYELTISAAVTARAPGSLRDDSTFDLNLATVRATGPWQGGTQNDGPFGGPKEFDLEFALDTPFRYNPAEGNLLLELVTQGPALAPFLLDRLADDDTSENALIIAWSWEPWSQIPTTAQRCVGGLVAEFTFLPLHGDYNHDTVVDDLDYTTWKAAIGSTVTAYAGADGNGNGLVDAADYTVWRDHRGSSVANGGVAIAIPEPASIGLLVVATALLGVCRFATNKYE